MIVIPEFILTTLMAQIAQATHELVDQNGEPVRFGTIDAKQMRSAAKIAIEIAVGDTVWPGDRKISLPRPKVSQGIFEEG